MRKITKLIFDSREQLENYENENGCIYAVSNEQGVFIGDMTEKTLSELQKEGKILSIDNPMDVARAYLIDLILCGMPVLPQANYIALNEHFDSLQDKFVIIEILSEL